jgi:uncharacterized membrane protein YidH (DUF202 family)
VSYLVGAILLALGLAFLAMTVGEFRKHGHITAPSKVENTEPAATSMAVGIMVITTCLILGGVYLLFPPSTGACLL